MSSAHVAGHLAMTSLSKVYFKNWGLRVARRLPILLSVHLAAID